MFELSNYIAYQVRDYDKAVNFYKEVMGFELMKYTEQESKFKAGNTYFFVEKNEEGGVAVFFEFVTDDIEAAKAKLLSEGCKITSSYSDKSHMFSDPYGMNFHVYERGADLPDMQ
jgi:catechol 2,3-dioxygenase-like lactoylglutathione lyase family enzyme